MGLIIALLGFLAGVFSTLSAEVAALNDFIAPAQTFVSDLELLVGTLLVPPGG